MRRLPNTCYILYVYILLILSTGCLPDAAYVGFLAVDPGGVNGVYPVTNGVKAHLSGSGEILNRNGIGLRSINITGARCEQVSGPKADVLSYGDSWWAFPAYIIENADITWSAPITGDAVFKLTVFTDVGESKYALATVSPNAAFTVDAGPDDLHFLPGTDEYLSGSTTASGTPKFQWTQVRGATATIESPATASTKISGLTTPGEREFLLTVTDSRGISASDNVVITSVSSQENNFTIGSSTYVTHTGVRSNKTLTVTDVTGKGELVFSFFNTSSIPTSGVSTYTIGSASNSGEISVGALQYAGTTPYYYYTLAGDNAGKTASVENRTGTLYITLPKIIVKRVGGASLEVSAVVHEKR